MLWWLVTWACCCRAVAPRPPPAAVRDEALLRAGPVTRSTAAHRELLLGRFARWLLESSPGSTLSQLAREDIPQLSALLEEYGVATASTMWRL